MIQSFQSPSNDTSGGDTKKRPLWLPYAIILGCLLIIGIVTLSTDKSLPQVRDAVVTSSLAPGKQEVITLPYSKEGAANEHLLYDFSIVYKSGQPTVFTITPDDCVEELTINGQKVTLEGDALKNRCNWSTGFAIDLRPYLNTGINKAHIDVLNTGGKTGLNVTPSVD